MARPRQLWVALGGALAAGALAGAAGLGRAARRRNGGDAPAAEDHQRPKPREAFNGGPPDPDGSTAPGASGSASGVRPRPQTVPRAFRLGRGEPAGEGLRRIILGRLDHALEELRGGDDRAVAVHEARKDLKKTRAVLRLLRARAGAEFYRRENAAFRATGRSLSGARDAQVRLDTLEKLVNGGGLDSAGLTDFIRRLEVERDDAAGQGVPDHQAAAELEQAQVRVRGWSVDADGWEAVEAGLRRSYRRGRARMRDAAQTPSTDNLHEWRKRVKDLWYHLRILNAAWPAVLEALADEAHVLSEQLGDEHDLAVLASSASQHFAAFPDPMQLDALLDAIERERGELQRAAFSLGQRLYADRPSVFTSRVETWWRAWRPDA